jgi:hypothetical protein
MLHTAVTLAHTIENSVASSNVATTHTQRNAKKVTWKVSRYHTKFIIERELSVI